MDTKELSMRLRPLYGASGHDIQASLPMSGVSGGISGLTLPLFFRHRLSLLALQIRARIARLRLSTVRS